MNTLKRLFSIFAVFISAACIAATIDDMPKNFPKENYWNIVDRLFDMVDISTNSKIDIKYEWVTENGQLWIMLVVNDKTAYSKMNGATMGINDTDFVFTDQPGTYFVSAKQLRAYHPLVYTDESGTTSVYPSSDAGAPPYYFPINATRIGGVKPGETFKFYIDTGSGGFNIGSKSNPVDVKIDWTGHEDKTLLNQYCNYVYPNGETNTVVERMNFEIANTKREDSPFGRVRPDGIWILVESRLNGSDRELTENGSVMYTPVQQTTYHIDFYFKRIVGNWITDHKDNGLDGITLSVKPLLEDGSSVPSKAVEIIAVAPEPVYKPKYYLNNGVGDIEVHLNALKPFENDTLLVDIPFPALNSGGCSTSKIGIR